MAHVLEWKLTSKWVPHPLISKLFNYTCTPSSETSYALSSAVTPISANGNRSTHYHIPSINSEDDNFMDNKSTTKNGKIT